MKEQTGYRAVAKRLPVSAHKVRPIANLIRRKPCVDALAMVDNMPNKGAKFLGKVLRSAVANAINKNNDLDEEMLFVKELLIDEGPSSRRIWPRGRGRADKLIKRSAHISVIVEELAGLGE